jgi:hypothetical protein
VEIKCQLDATDEFLLQILLLAQHFRAPLCPSSGAREYSTSVEQAIRSAIKIHLLDLVGILFPQ